MLQYEIVVFPGSPDESTIYAIANTDTGRVICECDDLDQAECALDVYNKKTEENYGDVQELDF